MKHTPHKRHPRTSTRQMQWLPLDTRILPDIFSFGHVKGIARAFLTIELILVSIVVIGCMLIAVLKAFS